MTKVFISYSHDSDTHRDFVRGLSDQLRADGLDCWIDQYVNGFPPEGWQRWMEQQVETADFVLLVCTANYLKRYRGEERAGGRGVTFEGLVISQTLYDHYYHNTKFIPLIPSDGTLDNVPLPLKGFNTYRLNEQYESLYRFLTGQPLHVAPPVGQVRKLVTGSSTQATPFSPPPSSTPASGNALDAINASRRKRLEEKLARLYEQYDLETRVEEKLRMKAIIDETETSLRGL